MFNKYFSPSDFINCFSNYKLNLALQVCLQNYKISINVKFFFDRSSRMQIMDTIVPSIENPCPPWKMGAIANTHLCSD